MTRDEIAAWKAQQSKRPLAERLSEIPGYAEVASRQPKAKAEAPQAQAGYDEAKKLQQQR
jgi:hypothetical protein